MPDQPGHSQPTLTTRGNQPLIGIPTKDGAEKVVRYFTSVEDADRALSQDDDGIQRALSAIGAWSDLDFDQMLDDLDQIRHRSDPTPPIAFDL
jgi:hypothetical protein